MPKAGTDDRSPVWPYLVLPGVLLLLVAIGPLYSWYSIIEHANAPDANIGYGLGFFWAAFWGIPWSAVPWFNPPASDVAGMAAYVGCGLINVALIMFITLFLRRRADRLDAQDRAST